MKQYITSSELNNGIRINETGHIHKRPNFNNAPAKIGGTGKANRLVNVQAQMEQVERSVIDVIDFRIIRKSGGLKR